MARSKMPPAGIGGLAALVCRDADGRRFIYTLDPRNPAAGSFPVCRSRP